MRLNSHQNDAFLFKIMTFIAKRIQDRFIVSSIKPKFGDWFFDDFKTCLVQITNMKLFFTWITELAEQFQVVKKTQKSTKIGCQILTELKKEIKSVESWLISQLKFKAHDNHLKTLMGKFKLMFTTCLTRGCLKNFFKFR